MKVTLKKWAQRGMLLCLAFLLSAPALAVENYPYRSDYLWVTVPDHADWLYQCGEKARWRYSSISMAFRATALWSGRLVPTCCPLTPRGR